MTSSARISHDVGGSIDTPLSWHPDNPKVAYIASGCGTGALELGINEVADLYGAVAAIYRAMKEAR